MALPIKPEIQDPKQDRPTTQPPTSSVTVATGRHRFVIDKVHCVDETGSGIGEWGKDDIFLGGVKLSATGAVKIPYFKVGYFNDGDRVTYNPAKELASFDGGGSAVWLVLVEKDSGDQMEEFLTEVVTKAGQAITAAVKKARKDASVEEFSSDDIDWTTVLKELFNVLQKLLVGWFTSARRDDIFKVQQLPYSSGSGSRKVQFNDHKGTYDIYYRWIDS